jgi:hypothetical protein
VRLTMPAVLLSDGWQASREYQISWPLDRPAQAHDQRPRGNTVRSLETIPLPAPIRFQSQLADVAERER